MGSSKPCLSTAHETMIVSKPADCHHRGLPTRVAVVASSISHLGGGIVEVLRGQSVALARMGVAVTVFAPEDGGQRVSEHLWEGVEVKRLRSPWPSAALVPHLARELQRADVEIVHLHGLWTFVSASVSAWRRRTSRPVIISPHGMLDSWAVRRSRTKKRCAMSLFEAANLRNAACLHALTVQEARAIRSFGLRNQITIIPNGVEMPDIVLGRRGTQQMKSRRVMLFLGRIDKKKGLMEALDAWAIFKSASPRLASQWKLIVAGWGDKSYQRALEAKRMQLDLVADVDFVGAVHGQEKQQLLASADAFILPSVSEGLPMAVLEAWSFALPVFMTDACNLPQAFANRAAIRITIKPAEMAAELLRHLGAGAQALLQVGEAGRTLVEREYRWDGVASKLADTYLRLIRSQEFPNYLR